MTDKENLLDHLLMARNIALQLGVRTEDPYVYNLGKLLERKLDGLENHFEKLKK